MAAHHAMSATTKAPMPAVGVICIIVGCIVLLGGVVMMFSVVSSSGSDAAAGAALGVMLSSVVWFAIARALALLAQIARNTARPENERSD